MAATRFPRSRRYVTQPDPVGATAGLSVRRGAPELWLWKALFRCRLLGIALR